MLDYSFMNAFIDWFFNALLRSSDLARCIEEAGTREMSACRAERGVSTWNSARKSLASSASFLLYVSSRTSEVMGSTAISFSSVSMITSKTERVNARHTFQCRLTDIRLICSFVWPSSSRETRASKRAGQSLCVSRKEAGTQQGLRLLTRCWNQPQVFRAVTARKEDSNWMSV